MTLKIQPLLLASLLLSLSVFAVSAQEVELRDSLEAARITAMRRMQRETGATLTTPEHIRATASPLGEGDALRWVQSLPGVATGADGTSAFYVRGGNSGGNLLTVDGIPIYGYSHILGITSVLPSDVIGSAGFVKGGFGGAQGNFSSSHIAPENQRHAEQLPDGGRRICASRGEGLRTRRRADLPVVSGIPGAQGPDAGRAGRPERSWRPRVRCVR